VEVIEGFPHSHEINQSYIVNFFIFNYLTNLCLQGADGVLVPGGFGDRGVQGKIIAARYARENRIPFLGICLGMQIAVIEFARSVLGVQDANSTEFDPHTKSPYIIFMPEVSTFVYLTLMIRRLVKETVLFLIFYFCLDCFLQGSKTQMGGTMRLGSRRTYFQTKECKSAKL